MGRLKDMEFWRKRELDGLDEPLSVLEDGPPRKKDAYVLDYSRTDRTAGEQLAIDYLKDVYERHTAKDVGTGEDSIFTKYVYFCYKSIGRNNEDDNPTGKSTITKGSINKMIKEYLKEGACFQLYKPD